MLIHGRFEERRCGTTLVEVDDQARITEIPGSGLTHQGGYIVPYLTIADVAVYLFPTLQRSRPPDLPIPPSLPTL